jgi:hypothetical protein
MANSNIEPGVYLDIHEATAYAGRPIQVSINKLDADGSRRDPMHGVEMESPDTVPPGAVIDTTSGEHP